MKLEIEVETLAALVELAKGDDEAEGVVAEVAGMIKQATSKLCVVRLDETEHWLIKNKPKKIWGVYLVDLSEQTYCCEVTPSYYLYFLYNTCSEPNEEVETYSSGDDESQYVHVSALNALPVIDSHLVPPFQPLELEESYDKFIEANIESLQANRVF